jgi:hypothetical protein
MKNSALSFLLIVVEVCLAFQVTLPPTSATRSANVFKHNVQLHMAKKKRRKRKEEPSDSSSPDISDDLPDFDLGEDLDDTEAPKKPPTPSDPDEITDAMMGTQKPLGSVKDLISDRSLESSFKFDEPENPLPDLGELKAPGVGKKRARQEARRAEAMANEEKEDRLVDNLSDALGSLPFLKSDRESSELKLVENATWLGIFLLVAWEIYINSPFFDRAAPIAPIVYQFLM